MRKIIFGLIATILVTNLFYGQVTLEHSYSNPSAWIGPNVSHTFYSESGLNYYTMNMSTKLIQVYDENHTLINSFTAQIPANSINLTKSIITDKLFDNNNQIEFLLAITDDSGTNIVYLINDSGAVIQEFYWRYSPEIVKNSNGAYKLILKGYIQDVVEVYTLPGTLSINQQNILLNKTIAYPNPTNDVINISNKFMNVENLKLEVFNSNGQKVIEENISNNKEIINLDVTNLSSGVYTYKLNGEVNKFIKR